MKHLKLIYKNWLKQNQLTSQYISRIQGVFDLVHVNVELVLTLPL